MAVRVGSGMWAPSSKTLLPTRTPNSRQSTLLNGVPSKAWKIVNRMHLPLALDRPEIGVVDGANGRAHRVQRFDATLHQGEVHRGDYEAEREEYGAHHVRKHVVEFEGGQVQ